MAAVEVTSELPPQDVEHGMDLELLQTLNRERAARRACLVITDLRDGTQRLVRKAEIASDSLGDVLNAHLKSGKSGTIEHTASNAFVRTYVPPPRLMIVGAVHISQNLAPMAIMSGFDVLVIDPRTAFATAARFPNVQWRAEWPDAVFEQSPPDAYTAVAALTHDPKIDDPALGAALAADCFYVGALGSRKTHRARLERLQAAGISEAQLARIHAPIGLNIGAQTPGEIAVAILAQLIGALRAQTA